MNRVVRRKWLIGSSMLMACCVSEAATAQTALPEINVTVASPIARRPAPRPAPPASTAPAAPAEPAAPAPAEPTADTVQGALPVVTDQFATVTVVPNEEIRRTNAPTLGDLLLNKPGITSSSFAPGASSRPIIRGLDVNRVGIVENGIGGGGASDLGEDHAVPIDPLTTNQVEVIRGPATLRYGSQSIGGVVAAENNRIPTALPCTAPGGDRVPGALVKAPGPAQDRGCVTGEVRGSGNSVNDGLDGAALVDGAYGQWAVHVDAFGRRAQDYHIPHYPYLTPPDPADAPRATQPGAFNGRQPNSSLRMDGASAGTSYIFADGYAGFAIIQNDALYHIPGIDGEDHNTRIDSHQTKLLGKGEYRMQSGGVDTIRYWLGVTDYKHHEIGLADDTNPASDGVRQIFTNQEQEARTEVTLLPFNLRFAEMTTAVGVQGGHQRLDAPSPDNAGLWDVNHNWRVASYVFNEFKFSPVTKAQVAGRIEHVELDGLGRSFTDLGELIRTPVAPSYTPKSASAGLIQDLPWNLVGSLTAQYVERAPKPAELFSGGGHDATATFDKGNPDLTIESAKSVEAGLRRAVGPLRFEATAYYTRFNGFIFRRLTGNTCDGDTGVCGPGAGDLREAIYSQRDATFRGAEFQSQYDVARLGRGWWGIEDQFDVVRATFTDGTNVPRIPPVRVGGGLFFRDDNWLARINLLHAFAQTKIAVIGETPTPGYNDLRAEVSYRVKVDPKVDGLRELTVGLVGTNLLNSDIRNHVSYTKDEVLLPGAGVRLFANVKF